MAVYELSIDPGPAEAGSKRIVKSFEDILAAANRMEGGVSARAQKLLATFKSFANVRTVSREAISQLTALSSALSGFRGPSKAAVDNTSRFLNFLSSVRSISLPSGARMASFLSALSGYKGPTATAGRNTQSLLRALSGFAPPAGLGQRLISLMSALGSFRGPNANAGRNVRSLATALASFSATPKNIGAAIAAFEKLAASINGAASAMGSYRRASGGNIRVPSMAGGGRGGFNPRAYANDLGFLNTALFRTQTAFHALGGILAARYFITASNDIIKIQAQLEAATGSVQQARIQFEFLGKYANQLGLELTSVSKSYGFFLGAIKGTNVTFAEAKEIFTGFSTAARALQLSTSDVDGVFRALGQIMSKGKLQAEELRGQLGDRLPGAFVRFARALDMTKPGQLDDALKKGAISGDKLKKAILEVARTMELEFAVSADKMSKTVDAAFNRLQNSFTMAAAGLGSSGLNDALINIADALRKFLESDALSNMLGLLGAAFKFLGENINAVVYILGTIALAAMFKWVAASTGAVAVMGALRAIMLQVTIAMAAMAAGMGRAAVATTLLGRAFAVLTTLVKANPFAILAIALVSLIALMAGTKTKTEELLDSLEKTGAASAVATNGVSAFTAELANNNSALDTGNQLLRERIRLSIIEKQTAYRTAQSQITEGTSQEQGLLRRLSNARMGMGFGKGQAGRYMRDSKGGTYDRNLIAILGQLPDRVRSEADYKRLYKTVSQLGATINYMKDGKDKEFAVRRYNQASGYLSTFDESSMRAAGLKPAFDFQGARNEVFDDPDRIRQGAGISGDVPEKTGGKKGGAGSMNAYEQDLRRAGEALRDLRRETAAAYAEMDALLKGGDQAAQEVAARAEAEAKVNNFMDSFANAAQAEKGIQDLNNQLRSQTDILDQLSPAARQAREELISFMAQEQLAKDQAKVASGVASRINDLKFENALQNDLVQATIKGGKALASNNIQLEVATALRGASADDAEKLNPILREQLQNQQRINDALKVAQQINGDLLQMKNMEDTSYLYNGSYNEKDIAYYKELIELRNQMVNDGTGIKLVNEAVRVRAALLNQKGAYEEIQEQHQKAKQMAQDMGDAFVDAFQSAIESGESFGSSLKKLFDNLKNIILNFVIYDPLRKWLADVFTVGNTAAGTGPATVSGGSAAAGLGSLITGLFGGGGKSAYPTSAGTTTSSSLLGSLSGFSGIRGFGGQAFGGGNSGASNGLGDVTTLLDDNNTILVEGTRTQTAALEAIPQRLGGQQYFSQLKQAFNWKENQKAITDVFKKGGATSENLSNAMSKLGTAFALYQTGNMIGTKVGKALGLGFKGSNVLGGAMGGAAAGFALGGPIGAAIGAVVGGVLGFMKKKPKIPSSFGSVVVGADGVAVAGSAGNYGAGSTAAGKEMAAGAARTFNAFAMELGAQLRAGSYGTFGRTKLSAPGEDVEASFYSLTGKIKKGRPVGVEGVDWIRGTDSQVQAWAIIQQFKRGMITGLTDIQKVVLTNTKATDMEQLQADIGIGDAYEAFIKGSFVLPDLRKQVEDLNDTFKKLKASSGQLGLSEEKLASARDRMMKSLKDDFNWTISQGILEMTDPRMAAYNELVREYRDAVDSAMAVGGDLAEVERYYGLKRAEILKATFDSAVDTIRTSAKELLDALTATTNSPLAAYSSFSNAQTLFTGLQAELRAGNTTNSGSLNSYASGYLETAQAVYGSSATYFDIFRSVTEFLQEMQGYSVGGGDTGTDPADIPALPSLEAMIEEITARDAELLEATQNVGTIAADVGAQTVEHLTNIENILAGMNGAGAVSGLNGSAGLAGYGSVQIVQLADGSYSYGAGAVSGGTQNS